jgi:hypothetical protein
VSGRVAEQLAQQIGVGRLFRQAMPRAGIASVIRPQGRFARSAAAIGSRAARLSMGRPVEVGRHEPTLPEKR